MWSEDYITVRYLLYPKQTLNCLKIPFSKKRIERNGCSKKVVHACHKMATWIRYLRHTRSANRWISPLSGTLCNFAGARRTNTKGNTKRIITNHWKVILRRKMIIRFWCLSRYEVLSRRPDWLSGRIQICDWLEICVGFVWTQVSVSRNAALALFWSTEPHVHWSEIHLNVRWLCEDRQKMTERSSGLSYQKSSWRQQICSSFCDEQVRSQI